MGDMMRHAKYWLTDLQLSDDPKQYLLGQLVARLEELEHINERLTRWDSSTTTSR
jgi:hypothetical protein